MTTAKCPCLVIPVVPLAIPVIDLRLTVATVIATPDATIITATPAAEAVATFPLSAVAKGLPSIPEAIEIATVIQSILLMMVLPSPRDNHVELYHSHQSLHGCHFCHPLRNGCPSVKRD